MKLQISSNEKSDKKIIEEVKSFYKPEDIEICYLPVGDLVKGNVCLELKTKDLISSLKSEKGTTTSLLRRQAYNMQQYPVRAVIVTRTIPEIFMDSKFYNIQQKQAGVPEEELVNSFDFLKLTGYLASIFVRFGVPVIPYGNVIPVKLKDGRTVSSLAYYIYSILEKGNDGKVVTINPLKAHASSSQEQEAIICSITDIGPKTAKALLIHFGSIDAVFKATPEQLKEVFGVGKETSTKIFELIHRPYQKEGEPCQLILK